MPFVLGTDGSYDVRLNRYFRALPLMRVRATGCEEYAGELVVWACFLAERRDTQVWDVDAVIVELPQW